MGVDLNDVKKVKWIDLWIMGIGGRRGGVNWGCFLDCWFSW